MANSCGRSLTSTVLSLVFLLCLSDVCIGQIRYSIPEEQERGTFVGNIVLDTGLNVRILAAREFRLVSDEPKQYFKVNLESGVLFVNERIDREELCGQTDACFLSFKVIVKNPLEIFRVEVEINDINDNSPSFPKSEISLRIGESIAPGARFPLESAHDPDVGTNAIKSYRISSNQYFGLKMQVGSDGSKSADLLLERALDRELKSAFKLVLSAIDGGVPERSGTAHITINVVDANDNAPLFDMQVYRASLVENSPTGAFVIRIHATDLDQGANAEIRYFFSNRASKRVRELFSVNSETGEINVKGSLDFEESNAYELNVEATDNGIPSMRGYSKVLVELIDVNDNAPEVKPTLVSSVLSENTAIGTVVALVSVTDSDSGKNGNVQCQIPSDIPFKLQPVLKNHYEIITTSGLDREIKSMYNISVIARDEGSPPLTTNKTILVTLSDVNDNSPRFTQSLYTVYVTENNTPGTSIFRVRAVDVDAEQNAHVTYSVTENRVEDMTASAYISLSSNNGDIYALQSFDYEQLKSFQFEVRAQDSGDPPLSSGARVKVIVLDQNDNPPLIVSPPTWNGSASVDLVPQSVYPGYLVTKVIATDADSGQNARLSYLTTTDSGLFSVGLHSGEVRTTRRILDEDVTTQRLTILVKDNGQPTLSTLVTISFSIGVNVTEKPLERTNLQRKPAPFSELNLYLIITLGSTSLIFLVTIIILFAIKCHQDGNDIYGYGSTICCWRHRNLRSSREVSNRHSAQSEFHNYPGERVPIPGTYNYNVCLSPESAKSDFLFLSTCNPTIPMSSVKANQSNFSQEVGAGTFPANNGH